MNNINMMSLEELREIARSSSADEFIWKNYEELAATFYTRGTVEAKKIWLNEGIDEAIQIFCPSERENRELKCDIAKAYFANFRISPEEYFQFGFHTLTQEERDTFISRCEKDDFYKKSVGLGEKYQLLHNKYTFYENFGEFFHRDVCQLSVDETTAFREFLEKHHAYIAKKSKGRGGFGTVIRYCDENTSVQDEIDFLFANGDVWVIEELISQHEGLSIFNPSSINTIRMTTYFNRNGYGVLDAVIRVGRKGAIVDNASSGGITAYIDKNTGIISSIAVDKHNNKYGVHPDSNIPFVGYQIPKWNELLDVTRKAHERIPYYPCVGWDFALSKEGWVVVEGNWGNLISQYILKKGLRTEFANCFM